MAARCTRYRLVASGLGFLISAVSFAYFDAIFFVRPFPQIDHLAAFATEGTELVCGVPLMLLATVRARDDSGLTHCEEQKVRSNSTSCSYREVLAVKLAATKRMLSAYLLALTSGMQGKV